MVRTKYFRRALSIASLALLVPIVAAAQITVQVPFDRTGEPGTTTVTQVDPLNPSQIVTVTVPTGAFINPCTVEYVDVTGVSLVQTTQTIDKFGFLKVSVSVKTSGSGLGIADNDGDFTNGGYTGLPTGSAYNFVETQSLSFRIPQLTGTKEFTSEFIDKITMRGSGSIDNWVVRARFRIKVNAAGAVQVFLVKMEEGACRG